MHSGKSLGIAVENARQRVCIFDTNTLEVLQQLPIDAHILDVAVSSDCSRAFVSSFGEKTIFQIDLCALPAQVVGSAVSTSLLEDVALTPDDEYVLAVDGNALAMDFAAYSVRQNAFLSPVVTSAQAVAISPRCRELVLTAEIFNNVVRRFVIHPDGSLENSGQTFPAGSRPINLTFSPSGEFAFVAATGDTRINVLSTLIPENVTLLGGAPSSASPQSLVVARDGRHVFALAAQNVDVYAFDPVAGNLTLERSFAHGLSIAPYFGVDQIALDACGRKLFISGYGQVAAFTTYGLPLGSVAGAEGPGGIAICPCIW